ncbi:MAG: iron ABC transporter substrate-binding protein, partial [Muribaculaceae bacterium]|nr:iron ABC transporter substrate-binding protein [Muribaculaceae bacterium]
MKTNLLLFLTVLFMLASCRGNVAEHQSVTTDSVITQAQLLGLERHEAYTVATIRDPWKQGGVLHRYVLVPADKPLPANLPEGTLVRTPLRSALVYSSVHTSLMRELGMFGSVKGVCDAQFFTDPEVTQAVKAGTIADCGSSMAPTIERVIAMQPDGILLSPYQDATYGQITTLDIPIIECADYMETTP